MEKIRSLDWRGALTTRASDADARTAAELLARPTRPKGRTV